MKKTDTPINIVVQEHELKTLPAYWDAIARGEKTFEVRRDDRGFQRFDILKLVRTEYLPDPERPTYGSKELSTLYRRVKYILTGGQFGIELGYVVMALEPCEVPE